MNKTTQDKIYRTCINQRTYAMTKTSIKRIKQLIAAQRDEGFSVASWERKILLGSGSDQEKIIDLHAHLEKRITDLVDDKDSNENEGDFYSTLQYAVDRSLSLEDIYQVY